VSNSPDTTPRALVVGGGPAGLMAAEQLAQNGCHVVVCDGKPSVGRKFLMAGKSGLNLTNAAEPEQLLHAYGEDETWLAPMVDAFGPAAIQSWASDLGQDVFTGSTGRVFPTAMKASPLLRAWLARLDALGVERRTRWLWRGWQEDAFLFDTPEGAQTVTADVCVLALGGASWARLGSDGAWAELLAAKGIALASFAPSNAGLHVAWSDHMTPMLGKPLKNVAFQAGDQRSRGEAVISARGLEGGGIYAIGRGLRAGAALHVDLLPDRSVAEVEKRLLRPRGKTSMSNHLRKVLKLGPERIALLNEFARPLPTDPGDLAQVIKSLPVRHQGLRPLDEAISTVGGVPQAELDDTLMLRKLPGVLCAGEMLDWDAPTGGYLLTGCLATGHWAGRAAAEFAQR